MTEQEYLLQKGVKMWNILFSIFFVILILVLYSLFLDYRPTNLGIGLFDIIILTLANYRLVRLFIYDNITLVLRELFMDLEITGEGENRIYTFVNSKKTFKLTIHKLLNCPWCFGVWTVFISAFLYFTFPVFKILFMLLAVAGVASFLIILTNLIGWHAEGKKLEVQGK